MNTEPYYIYTRNRPYRIAFLIDPAAHIEWVNIIQDFNRDKWGGRFNPIILTDGNTISPEWWKFLCDYDPDIIFSVPQLSNGLKRKMHIFLTPFTVVTPHDGQRFVGIHEQPLSFRPSPEALSQIRRSFMSESNSLCYFIVSDATPLPIKTFLQDNFGITNEYDLRYVNVEQERQKCNAKDFRINTLEDLNAALLELGDFKNRFVLQSQLCSLPNTFKETDYSHTRERLEVVIGDSIDEKVYAWNRQLDIPSWMRTQLTQLLISRELFEEPAIQEGLLSFINRYTSSIGNDNARGTTLVSFTVPEAELRTLLLAKRGLRYSRGVNYLTSHPTFSYERAEHFYLNTTGRNFHRANSNEETLTIEEPTIGATRLNNGSWLTDLAIEYRPERFKHIIGRTYWWRLPKRNSILRDCRFFNKEARIDWRGMFSVQVRGSWEMRPDENLIQLKLPDDETIFYSLFCGDRYDSTEQDQGRRYAERPFYTLQISDKGKYLLGVLKLCSNLYGATHLFEERYWRDLFARMSNREPEKDVKAMDDIRNTLKRPLDRGIDLKTESGLSWLTNKVAKLSRKYSRTTRDFTYREMEDLAKKETDEYNANPSGQVIPFNEEDFRRTVSDLIESKILLLGVRPKCPHCGFKIWYEVDEIKTLIECSGCGYKFSLKAEPTWSYRLNSLINSAVSEHGTVPLILTLGDVTNEGRSSAIFSPSLDLIKKDEDGELVIDREIDLACIVDGKFIIGEVKESNDLFEPRDFERMEEIAKTVRPDKIIFSSLEEKPTRHLLTKIEELRGKLLDLEIEVEWHSIKYWVFRPHPVR